MPELTQHGGMGRMLFAIVGSVITALIIWLFSISGPPFVPSSEYNRESIESRLGSVESGLELHSVAVSAVPALTEDVGELKARLNSIDDKLNDMKEDTGKIATIERILLQLLEEGR